MNSSFRDPRVWLEAMNLTEDIYSATAGFPKHEVYGLSSQMRRAAVVISRKERDTTQTRSLYGFFSTARGSLLELETQILIARRLQYLSEEISQKLCRQTAGIGRGLSALIDRFRAAVA